MVLDFLTHILRFLMQLNSLVLRWGRNIAWVALAIMVMVILLQVFFRYVLNNALAWPDEAARFLMLWMTGLMAPSAFRQGAFVAIDMVPQALPRRPGLMLAFVLLMLSAMVLLVCIHYGWLHTMGFGGNFDSSSLKVPLDWFGMAVVKVKLRYMYASLLVGVILLLSVNLELLMTTIVRLLRPDTVLPADNMVLSREPG
ncbi:MAG: TRAP transporter small permease subunit [Arenicellales bacterium]|jgi:TRAP-type C4-dicarboxylate transport system permease small subunit|nr:TRAP transporter small permease subunit [Arenicellales bacterium]|tara:strand:+ start:1198 stop:1794 length:597 start_codon:yes stop_codon:yes gene_type:complete